MSNWQQPRVADNYGGFTKGVAWVKQSPSADLGGSRKKSNENFEDRSGEGFHVNSISTCGGLDRNRNVIESTKPKSLRYSWLRRNRVAALINGAAAEVMDGF